jgi:antitoxin (DNA-binding transcriptional repressor) of toxin-antitoxin stability system
MNTVSLNDEHSPLAEVIRHLVPDQVLIIVENDRPIARVIPVPAIRTRPLRARPPVTGVPRAGTVPGLIVPNDFKEPLEDLREYME